MLFLGIDVGTQGIRAIAADKCGNVVSACSTPFEHMDISGIEGHREQDAAVWWSTVVKTIRELVGDLKGKGIDPGQITALAVDGTSGTVVPLDKDNEPLCNGFMYNDSRALEEAGLVQEKGGGLGRKLGYVFNSSYALPKMLWIKKHMPDIFRNTAAIVHQADFIVGRLTGNYRVSDYSNALKSGYDLIDMKWPDFIEKDLGIKPDKLLEILPPGSLIGRISPEASRITGLSTGTAVAAGATDGYASAIASGAIEPGDFNTTIGTTMVIKGVTKSLIRDDKGRIYCHLHPEGFWMPGGASNTGGRCLNERFDKALFREFDKSVEEITPTSVVVYPLTGTGERFPFVNREAREFIFGGYKNDKQLYAALLEGVAYVERLSYETLEELGCEVGSRIFAAGGAVKSREWLQIRANVLGKTLVKPCVVEAAMGSAIIAASKTLFGGITEAVRSMVKTEEEILPQPEKAAAYEKLYAVFKKQCRIRGYIEG